MTFWILNIAQAVPNDSLTRLWENRTVFLTTASAVFACIGVVFSFWEDKKKPLRVVDRLFSSAGAFVGVMAAVSLVQYTQYNRIDEAAANKLISKSAQDASSAIAGLGDDKQALLQTQRELIATSKKAKQSIQELNAALAQANRVTDLQVLITKMNSDDAEAFDELRSMKSFDSPEQEKMVKEAVQRVIGLHNVQGYIGASSLFYKYSPEPDEAIRMLSLKDTETRKSALRCLMSMNRGEYVPKAGPIVFHVATTDPSLDARTLATEIINQWGNDDFTALEPENLQSWWYTKGGGKEQFP